MANTLTEAAQKAEGYLGQPMVEVAGTTVTSFMIVRTVLIVIGVIVLVALAKRALSRARDRRPDVTRTGYWLLGKLATWGLIIAGMFFALSSLGVDLTKATLIMSALTLGIGFGLQNVINNFVSGLILMFERSVRLGDWIEVGTTQGIVKRINMRSTVVSTFDRAEIVIPNSDLLSRHVTNWTLLDHTGRILIDLEVLEGPDPQTVCDVLLEIAEADDRVSRQSDPGIPVARILDIGQRGLNYRLQCFVDDVMTMSSVRADLLLAIMRAFKDRGINLAFANAAAPSTESVENT